MMRFVTKHPWLTLALVLMAFCVIFGPSTVGYWIGANGRAAIVGAFRFVAALVRGAV